MATKVHVVKAMTFLVVMYVCMWELDHTEGWEPKDWCFEIVVLEKTAESPLDCKEIKPVNPKGNQPWIFIGRTDAEAEVSTLWPPNMKSRLFEKDPNAGKVQFSSVAQSCLTLCDPMDAECHTSLSITNSQSLLKLLYIESVGDAIQPSHPLSSPSPPVFNLSQHQGHFRWV